MSIKRVGVWTAAIALIAIGVMVIVQMLGLLQYSTLRYFWPAIVILFGLEMIWSHTTSRGAKVRYSAWSIVLLVFVTIAGLGVSFVQHIAVASHGRYDISFDKRFAEPVDGHVNTATGIQKVVIHLRNAPVTVTGTSSPTLSYVGLLTIHAASQQAAKQLIQTEWSVQKHGSTLDMTLKDDRPGFNIPMGGASYAVAHLNVRVPAQLLTTVVTTNGAIRVKHMNASVNVQSTNGAVELNDVTGKAVAHTSNSTITLQHTMGSVDAETTNGTIGATSAVGGPWRCVTTNGSVNLQFTGQPSLDVNAYRTNGHFGGSIPWVKNGRNHATAKIGSGKYQVEIHTTNGGVNVDAS